DECGCAPPSEDCVCPCGTKPQAYPTYLYGECTPFCDIYPSCGPGGGGGHFYKNGVIQVFNMLNRWSSELHPTVPGAAGGPVNVLVGTGTAGTRLDLPPVGPLSFVPQLTYKSRNGSTSSEFGYGWSSVFKQT